MTRPALIELHRGRACAAIAPLGAELRRWRVGETELMWAPDPAIWPAVSPILFPIVGRLRGGRSRVDGREIVLPIHGFAAGQEFAVESTGPDFACLTLVDTAATRECFPFHFRLRVAYRLLNESLSIALEVENAGARAMPYACGLHPGFRWPLEAEPREGHAIVFNRTVDANAPQVTPEGLFTAATRRLPLRGRILRLEEALFTREALCFLGAQAESLRYVAPNGASLTIATTNFDHWALWTRPPAPFLCIESWTGHGDPEYFAGDLFAKPSMRVLEPGAAARHSALYSWSAARTRAIGRQRGASHPLRSLAQPASSRARKNSQ